MGKGLNGQRDFLHVATKERPSQSAQEAPGMASLSDLMGQAKQVSFARNEEIFSAESPAAQVMQLESGCALMRRLESDGSWRAVAIVSPGDIIGYTTARSYEWDAVATTGSVFKVVSQREVEKAVAESATVARDVLRNTLTQLTRSREFSVIVHKGSLLAKVSAFLLWWVNKDSDGDGSAHILMPMTRKSMGEVLGVAQENISRTLTELKEIGAIQRLKQGSFILDVPKLKELAGE